MKEFNEEVKKQLEIRGLTDTVLEIGWNYLQARKEAQIGDSVQNG